MLTKSRALELLNSNNLQQLLFEYSNHRGHPIKQLELIPFMIRDNNRMLFMVDWLLTEFKITKVITKENKIIYT